MASTTSLPSGGAGKTTGLEVWMGRVLECAEQVRDGWDEDAVHDLRVALRRCRTIAEALAKVNPAPGWRRLKKASREVFHALGELRDTQVERSWVKRLGAASDPVRKHLLRVLARQEQIQRKAAERALDGFDRKEWKKLARKLPSRARFFPAESVVFQRLALAALNNAVGLYQQARARRSSVAWHRLRIGIKNFRYIVENFLPRRYELWADDLKRMQDVLGEMHDFDVLRRDVRRQAGRLDAALAAQWLERISGERKARLGEFLAKASGKDSPWPVWRAGFQWGHAITTAALPQRRTA